MGGCPILCAFCKGWDTRRSVSRFVVSHPSQKARRMGHPAPGDLLHFLRRTRNAPFHIPRVGNAGGRLKESRMMFASPTKPYRKPGVQGPAPREYTNIRGIAPVVPTERLIVALDFPGAAEALSLVDQLEGASRWFKVGLELYLAAGNGLVAKLQRRGFSVFLDLKFHDIPNTVASAVRSAGHLGVSMLTVHAAGGPDMLTAAVQAAGETDTSLALLAVTVLTSMEGAQLEATGVNGSAAGQVEKLASMALACGVQGLVCSAAEVASLRSRLGSGPLLVIPGIRPEGADKGDQRRVATPATAIEAGASYLVVGRPITRAADPGAAARAILAEIQGATNPGI
jgi:orotidine-5'-phosphate decarboxylase